VPWQFSTISKLGGKTPQRARNGRHFRRGQFRSRQQDKEPSNLRQLRPITSKLLETKSSSDGFIPRGHGCRRLGQFSPTRSAPPSINVTDGCLRCRPPTAMAVANIRTVGTETESYLLSPPLAGQGGGAWQLRSKDVESRKNGNGECSFGHHELAETLWTRETGRFRPGRIFPRPARKYNDTDWSRQFPPWPEPYFPQIQGPGARQQSAVWKKLLRGPTATTSHRQLAIHHERERPTAVYIWCGQGDDCGVLWGPHTTSTRKTSLVTVAATIRGSGSNSIDGRGEFIGGRSFYNFFLLGVVNSS